MDGNGPAPSEPDTEVRNLTLHILSPSPEVPDRITFTDCTPSTTIADLKAKIRGVVATRPAPERQRLICGGRLIQDNATLADIFTQNAVGSHKLGIRAIGLTIGRSVPPKNSLCTW